MAWCFSTRASVATVLTTYPCISRCLRVNIKTPFYQYRNPFMRILILKRGISITGKMVLILRWGPGVQVIPWYGTMEQSKLAQVMACCFIKSSPPSAAYMHQWIMSALVQIMLYVEIRQSVEHSACVTGCYRTANDTWNSNVHKRCHASPWRRICCVMASTEWRHKRGVLEVGSGCQGKLTQFGGENG